MNPDITVFRVSNKTKAGLNELVDTLKNVINKKLKSKGALIETYKA
ncbi:hypothetical protein PL321_15315 [Caloramator sp. mosi_1]|nr:hypothetical protein [Caloramator sp. mosi_1]WDC83836.1 hypothetical protein PL321_15315 [Caloramator sp. mosi_1]